MRNGPSSIPAERPTSPRWRRAAAPTRPDDITLPPTWTGQRSGPSVHERVEQARAAATLHAAVSAAITALMAGWTLATGAVPALDPDAGIPLLILHIGAFFTGSLALSAGDRADQLLQAAGSTEPPVLPGQRVVALSCIIINAAMVVASMMN